MEFTVEYIVSEDKAVTLAVVAGSTIYALSDGRIVRIIGNPVSKTLYNNEVKEALSNFERIRKLGYYETDKTDELKTIQEKGMSRFISDKSEKTLIENMKRRGMWILEKGWLLVRFRETVSQNEVIETFRPMRSITLAIRAFDHIIKNYKGDANGLGEVLVNRRIQENLLAVIDALSAEDLDDKNKKFIDQALSDIALKQLLHARNAFKQEASDYALESAGLEDSKGRFNPGAVLNKLTTATNRLDQRITQIGGILSYSMMRREELITFQSFMEYHRRRAVNRIDAAIGLAMEWTGSKAFRTVCNQAIYSSYRFWVSPYYVVHHEVVDQIERAKDAFSVNKKEKTLCNLLIARHFLANEIKGD